MNLYISTKKGATSSLVSSETNLSNTTIPLQYIGDNVHVYIKFLDGDGGLSEFVGRSDAVINVGVGEAKSRQVNTRTNILKYDSLTSTYSALLDFGTSEMLNAIGNENTITLDFEVQISFYENEYTETLLQTKIEFSNQLIGEKEYANVISQVTAILL